MKKKKYYFQPEMDLFKLTLSDIIMMSNEDEDIDDDTPPDAPPMHGEDPNKQ